MPVYDIAGAIRPQDTVGDFYQGKALRAQIAAQEKATDLMDEEVAIRQQNADTSEGNLGMRKQEYSRAVINDVRKMTKDQQAAIADSAVAYAEEYERSGDPAMATKAADALMTSFGFPDQFPDGQVVEMEHMQPFLSDDIQAYRKKGELTADEKFIDGLNVSDDEKDRLKLAIARKKGTITGTTEFDPGGKDPRTDSQAGAAFQENLEQYNESSNIQEMIGSVLPRVEDLPNAVGFTGKAAIAGAGVLDTLGYEELADGFSKWLAQASPEEVSGVMAQLQAVRGQLIPIVTGQESRARLSDQEQALGDKAVALITEIKGPADLAKAYPQVVGALRQFYEESWAKKYRLASQDEFIDYPYDLNSREEMLELVEESVQSGLDDDSIRRMITRLRQIQGIQVE